MDIHIPDGNIVHVKGYSGAPNNGPIEPEAGSVEAFLLRWTQRLPDHIKKAQLKHWSEHDARHGFRLSVSWHKRD